LVTVNETNQEKNLENKNLLTLIHKKMLKFYLFCLSLIWAFCVEIVRYSSLNNSKKIMKNRKKFEINSSWKN